MARYCVFNIGSAVVARRYSHGMYGASPVDAGEIELIPLAILYYALRGALRVLERAMCNNFILGMMCFDG